MAENTEYPTADHVEAGVAPAEAEETTEDAEETVPGEPAEEETEEGVPG